MREDFLFSGDGTDPLGRIEADALARVRAIPDDAIRESDPELIVATIIAGIHAQPVELDETGASQDDPTEITVTVSDYGEMRTIPGIRYAVRYPFTGFPPLLNRQPSTWYSSFPRGRVEGNTVIFEYELAGYDHGDRLKSDHDRNLDLFKKFTTNSNADLENILAHLPERIARAVGQRRDDIKAKQASTSALGIPVRAPGPVRVTAANVVQLREVVPLPQKRSATEPVSIAEFDGILQVVETAGINWERNPRMTTGWGEDEFREAINSYLNLIYAKTGSVTGETFICSGKSDILIRHHDVDVFIAECKIWGGKARVHADMGQLFDRYLTWRATRAALIYFNRGRNTTEAVENLAEEIASHPCHVKTEVRKGNTHLRFQMRHPSDEMRIFSFAVLMFPVQQ